MNGQKSVGKTKRYSASHEDLKRRILECIAYEDKPTYLIVEETNSSYDTIKKAMKEFLEEGVVTRMKRKGFYKKFRQAEYFWVRRYDLWRDF